MRGQNKDGPLLGSDTPMLDDPPTLVDTPVGATHSKFLEGRKQRLSFRAPKTLKAQAAMPVGKDRPVFGLIKSKRRQRST